ncbi:hypothetical protein OJ837_003893 [Cronobacter sakazakii]|nr:hypothetical protein [Cronobacter sakazakii]
MSTISTEQAKDLRNAFECWQQDYDPVEDKEQYDMFGLGIVAMDELLALRKERERAEPVVCQKCGNTGLADSGGVQPWGEPILIECDCTAPPAQEYPETLPCPVILEPNFRLGKGVRTATMLRALQTRAEHQAELDAMTPEQRAEYEARMDEFKAMLPSPSKDSMSVDAQQAETDTTAKQFESLAGKAVVPAGWKLVPVEPTKEMIAKMRYHNGGYDKHIKNGYAAMLAVAPEPCK